jgi:5S rRNA maturation endonuclease (ribonuclease M5)
MQVTKEGIESIKGANPLEAVVAERGIELRRKGRHLVAHCPFHADKKTASFTVTPSRGLFHCFGCGAAGDVIGFVTKHDKLSFPAAVKSLAERASLNLESLMRAGPRLLQRTPVAALTPPPPSALASGNGHGSNGHDEQALSDAAAGALLARVVDHYHRTFCERKDAQEYLGKRGLTDHDLLRALRVGYADGSLLKTLPRGGDIREQLVRLGVVTPEGRELLGGCIVVPIPDPVSGQWVNLYGRGLRTPRHCYLPGPFRGVLNFHAARTSDEVILTESILDAMSFLQTGIGTAIPLYGTNGFTSDHLDLLKREQVRRVILALDTDEPGERAASTLKGKLEEAGLVVRIARFPEGTKDANALLVSRNGDATEALKRCLDEAEPRPLPPPPVPPAPAAGADAGGAAALILERDGLTYSGRVQSTLLGRLRVTVKVMRGDLFHVDTVDLYASRSRAELAKRVSKAFGVELASVESALLSLVVEAERSAAEPAAVPAVPAMSESERAEALAFLKRPDLLDQVAADIDALGYVGEDVNKRLLYLVAISRKLEDPLSAIVMSQSGAGKSGLTEVIEKLCPPEDVVLLTRLTPQSLYYVEPGFLDRKLVIVEERYGSLEADYSIRVLQSRKKLIAAAPVKDPQTGNMRTKVFTVEARAAFIEATTASAVNHENATRCFELTMDESPEQTRRIHERQRLHRTERGLQLREAAVAIMRRHWNAQRLLDPLPVVIPYADRLSFPYEWMRTRRDHARFLNLIEVSAFLHQHQRERAAAGAIVASLADYETAYALAGDVLTDTLADLKKPLREAYARIRELSLKGEGPLTRSAIREALALPDSTVRRWLSDLVELEYLEADQAKQGKAAHYSLTSRAPKTALVVGLLSPEELASRLPNFATSPNFATPAGGVPAR